MSTLIRSPRPTARTLAYGVFEHFYHEFSVWDTYSQKYLDNSWPTEIHETDWYWTTANPNARFPGQRHFLNSALIRKHLNHSTVIAVLSKSKSRYVAIDLDCHPQHDPAIFYQQAEILVHRLWGRDGWHCELREFDLTGIHFLRVFEQPTYLDKLHLDLRNELITLDIQYPELAEQAHATGMSSFSGLELFPSRKQCFGLPGRFGYQTIIDRPLENVKYRGKSVFDVESYARWLQDPDRRYLPRAELLDLIADRLPNKPAKSPSGDIVTISPRQPGSLLGSLRGRCRKVLTEFWSGKCNPVNTLNSIIAVSLRVLYHEQLDQTRAVDLVKTWVRELPENALNCSKRLAAKDYRAIDRDIERDGNTIWNDNGGQTDPETSTEKLKTVVSIWRKGGFRLSDKTTWDKHELPPLPDFQFNETDQTDITTYLLPVLGRFRGSVVEVARAVASLAAVKSSQGNGISVNYWRMFFTDLGIDCAKNEKVKAIIDACLELELIKLTAESITGWARQFDIGPRIQKYLQKGAKMTDEKLYSESDVDYAGLKAACKELTETEVGAILEADHYKRVNLEMNRQLAAAGLRIAELEWEKAVLQGFDAEPLYETVKECMATYYEFCERLANHDIDHHRLCRALTEIETENLTATL